VQQAAESAGSLESLATEVSQALAVFQVGDAAAEGTMSPMTAPSATAEPAPEPAVAAGSARAPALEPAPERAARRDRPAGAAAPRLPAARPIVPARQPAREEEWEEF
jgi:hypothetical protein